MKVSKIKIQQFKDTVWDYYKANGRDLPWRNTLDPYKIFISEVMLQQTQVSRVIPKYELFIKKLPGFRALAKAPLSAVLALWHGLGYNRRAIALQKAAQIIVSQHDGRLPENRETLEALPGIGKGTSGSLLAFAYNRPAPFIETNIRRVYIDFFFKNQTDVHDDDIMALVTKTIANDDARHWYYALMDYGAMLGLTAKLNPNRQSKHYHKQSKFKGSRRELRGRILALLLVHKTLSHDKIIEQLTESAEKIQTIIADLIKEGFITKIKNKFALRTS